MAQTTTTNEIPKQVWSLYLDEIADRMEGHAVRIELVGRDIGAQPLTRVMSLRGIELVEKGSAQGTIELELGEEGQFDHLVLHPKRVFARSARGGEVESLDIEDENDTKTLITFDHPLPISFRDISEELSPVRVREYMTPLPGVVERGSSVADAYDVMLRTGGRHVPVIDEQGRVIGILSDRDLFLTKGNRAIDPERVTVDEVMTPDPYTVAPDGLLREAAIVMSQRRFGSAVVVDGQRVVGILTTVDALRALVDQLRRADH